MSIEYFNLYQLNFSKFASFQEKMDALTKEETDDFRTEFSDAGSAVKIRGIFAKGKEIEESLFNMVLCRADLQKEALPGFKMFQQMVSDIVAARAHTEALLAEFKGADPYEIQELVNKVLGISVGDAVPWSVEQRQKYFNLMKESGFLTADDRWFNGQVPASEKYQPGVLVSRFLQENPNIKTLTIGCGAYVKTNYGSCYYRKPEEHDHHSFTIDISSTVGPDLVVNMHNPDFWKGIPAGRLECIQDHTYGYFLFESEHSTNTLQEIFRTLKPGGFLAFESPFRENNLRELKAAGFDVGQEEETTKARKPG